ncbi:MAG: ATP-dependent helicase [Rhodobacterales bacterium]|nr:MAG: ATP-dependent helicase [Rhodobacterales bacterium]
MTQAFDKLAPPIRNWIRNQGWSQLHEIQDRAIHRILDGKDDVIISAPTAGGKSEAAFLPLLSQICQMPAEGGGFDMLYVAPLKALISDQKTRLDDMCDGAGLAVFPWHGDVIQSVKKRALSEPGGVLLITPEALEAMFVLKASRIPDLFRSTRAVVIDELHSFLGTERGVQLNALLTRLEEARGAPLRRVGLSATLGDMDQTRSFLRPDDPERVSLIEANSDQTKLLLRLRAVVSDPEDTTRPPAQKLIAAELFAQLRGTNNLVFAGSRKQTEVYTDLLHQLSDLAGVPHEFHAHYANLSQHHRQDVEARLKSDRAPTTAICTSTLELGIDIGDVRSVALIGAPYSVASLRQRLGRSGRQPGQPAILRQYVVTATPKPDAPVTARLRLELVQAIAMIELLLEGWCEPPAPQALHLSTLVQQILSIIAGSGGARMGALYETLCQRGPFRTVSKGMFNALVNAIMAPDSALIEPAPDGLLLLGENGERLVAHYDFFAVFDTSNEYRIVSDGLTLGTLPFCSLTDLGMPFTFAGRRWEVSGIDEDKRVLYVTPSKACRPPDFQGTPGAIHDTVVDRMFALLDRQTDIAWIDQVASELLREARDHFQTFRADYRSSALNGGPKVLLTRLGTVKTATLALEFRAHGYTAIAETGLLRLEPGPTSPSVTDVLTRLVENDTPKLFEVLVGSEFGKYHRWLTQDLLIEDVKASHLDVASLPIAAAQILEGLRW